MTFLTLQLCLKKDDELRSLGQLKKYSQDEIDQHSRVQAIPIASRKMY